MKGISFWWTFIGMALIILGIGIYFFMPLVRFSDLGFLSERAETLDQIITLSYLFDVCTDSFELLKIPECQLIVFASGICFLMIIIGFILLVKGMTWAK